MTNGEGMHGEEIHAMWLRDNVASVKDSQDSEHIDTSGAWSSHNSQSTVDGHEGASTPPTSDGISSQSTGNEGSLSHWSQASRIQRPVGWTADSHQHSALGHKRTADGQWKHPTYSPKILPSQKGHARNQSSVSNTTSVVSRIGDLSSDLRTRLSYAMVKVNNGWQTNSIEEVETLASQVPSPTSSSCTLHGRLHQVPSPRSRLAALKGNPPRQSFPNVPSSDFDLYGSSEPSSQPTYESFWREHQTTVLSHQTQQKASSITPPPYRLSLAPPPDIRPASQPRRSDPQSPMFLTASTPRTPSRPQDTLDNRTPTPSHQTLQEQDAIETLLFMSSPGNSGSMGQGHKHALTKSPPQASPLRTALQQSQTQRAGGRKLRFETGAEGYSPARRVTTANSSFEKKQAIDKLLDEMGETISSDEDDVILYSNPRRNRLAAGGA